MGARAREAFAIVFWCFSIVKLLVFDFDVYLLERFAPAHRWILDAKLIVFLVIVATLWLALGHVKFVGLFGYVLAYPIILALWRFPQYLYGAWPLVIVFAPIVASSSSRVRSSFILYTIALAATWTISTQDNVALVAMAMGALGIFLALHLYRRLLGVYSPTLFSELARLTREARTKIGAGEIELSVEKQRRRDTEELSPEAVTVSALSQLYMVYSLADFVSMRVRSVARGRRYELYLVLMLLYTAVLTSVVFALEYWALNNISPGAFSGSTDTGFEGFFRFSLGILTTSNVSSIMPVSKTAGYLSSAELLCSILIIVALAFVILTAARESFREDLEEFSTDLRKIAIAIERRARGVHQMSLIQLETFLLEHNSSLVNRLRKMRGLNDLTLSSSKQRSPRRGAPPAQQVPHRRNRAKKHRRRR